MDIAIVTGAETPLGLSIVEALVQQGYRVHGIGNNFSKVTYADKQFKAYPVDLTDLDVVASTLNSILEEEKRIDCLVHAIDVTPGTAFDKLPPGNLEAILKIGLLGPVMMTRLALPNLLRFRGQLINIITSNKHGHKASAANALIEGGLREMNHALFDQGRDAGLRITNCVLRQNVELPAGSISDDALAQSHIDLQDVARTIGQLIDPKAVNVPAEVVLHPRLSAKAEEAQPKSILPLDAYSEVVLPPKEYCPPEQPKIPTAEKQQIERTIPYTDEEMEEKIAAAIEDYEAHPERYDQPDPAPAKQRQSNPRQSKPQPKPQPKPQQGNPQQGNSQQGNPEQDGQQQDGQGNNKRRRRRRGGRNRNRNAQEGGAPKQEDASAAHNQTKAKSDQPKPNSQPNSQPDPKPSPNPESGRKPRSGRKPKPKPKPEPQSKPDAGSRPAKPSTAPASSDQVAPAREKPTQKKTATKKAAKKSVKKAAKKKTVTKKAVKKKAAKKTAKKE